MATHAQTGTPLQEWLQDIAETVDRLGYGLQEVSTTHVVLGAYRRQEMATIRVDSPYLTGALLRELLTPPEAPSLDDLVVVDMDERPLSERAWPVDHAWGE